MSEYLSEEGLEKLKQELRDLKTKKRQEIALRLEHAKSLGDLSENAEYQETKEEQSFVEGEIAELEERIRNAVLIKKDSAADRVAIGSTVRVRSERGEETYMIVGFEESDPLRGKISNESPIGMALLGREKGDVVDVVAPAGKFKYEILKVA
mgnify:CR=1 FL=1